MKSTTILVAFILFVGLAATPTVTHANTAQAIQLNDTTVLFLIDFAVTAAGGVYELPIIASSRVGYTDRVDTVGYKLQSPDVDTPSISNVSGIVLSATPIGENNRYTLLEDAVGNFRLAIFATFSDTVTSDVLARITKLPYWVNDKRTTVHQNQLDDLATATLTTS